MNMSSQTSVRALALLVLASLAAACGGSEEKAATVDSVAASAQSGGATGKPAPASAASVADEHMANAVVVGKTAAAVDLKYDLAGKPVAGQPFEIELAFLPRMAADTLEIETSGMAGITVVTGGTDRFENVVAGEQYVSKLLVQVAEQGLYYIGVTAKLSSRIQTDARTFSVPVVVGTVPEQQKPAAAADGGAAVKSMQAVETTTPAEKQK
jgi:hypothetical protein